MRRRDAGLHAGRARQLERLLFQQHGRATWQASARNKINFTYEYQNNCNCIIRLIAQNRAAEAVGNHFYSHQFPQVSWSFPATNKLLFERARRRCGRPGITGSSGAPR